MNFRQYRYRAWIVSYAEGTLDARRRAKLEAWLAHDPVLAAEAEAERRVVARLRALAQSAGSVPGEKNLWPGIQSRLEPRRSLVRPLILVGSLSAAATSLAWAMLWGPLGHPASPPPVVVVSNTGTPDVIVIEPSMGHQSQYPGRRPRHGRMSVVKRPAAPHVAPGDSLMGGRRDDNSLLAQDETSAPVDGGEQAPATPRFVPGGAAHLHLAANVRPIGHTDGQADTPPTVDGGAANGDASAADPVANGASVAADGGGDTVPTTGGTAPKAAKPEHPTKFQHFRRHHRRHAHHTRPAGAHGNTPPTAATSDTTPPVSGTDVHPKAGSKPVD